MAADKGRSLVVRCLVYPSENDNKRGYFAICLDFNLFTWRPTLNGAKKSLENAIEGYLQTVYETSTAEEIEKKGLYRLAYQPAPFFPYFAQYHVATLSEITKLRILNNSTFQQTYPLPA